VILGADAHLVQAQVPDLRLLALGHDGLRLAIVIGAAARCGRPAGDAVYVAGAGPSTGSGTGR
jgi:hypothetical protein